jgi:histidinol phosphatase-like PHP family hydrolase
VIKLLKDEDLYNVFSDCAEKGLGIELNMKTLAMTDEEKVILLRPYYIAKDCGCKFYLGSDAHKVEALETAKDNFENIVTLLGLEEKDKFELVKTL